MTPPTSEGVLAVAAEPFMHCDLAFIPGGGMMTVRVDSAITTKDLAGKQSFPTATLIPTESL